MSDGMALRELALFAGAGGGILGGHLLGWRTVCAVEYAAYPRSILLARQRDGILPAFPIWDDVRTFDGRPWRGSVDIVTGGFPCQDISIAGSGAGLDGERSGLWTEMARIIGEVQPRFAFVENSPMLTSRGLDRVLGDLSTLGYDAVWGVVGADDAGAPHRRERIWILAYAVSLRLQNAKLTRVAELNETGLHAIVGPCTASGQYPIGIMADPDLFGRIHGQAEEHTAEGGFHAQRDPIASGEDVAYAHGNGLQRGIHQGEHNEQRRDRSSDSWWSTEPYMGGMVDGVATAMDLHGADEGEEVPRVATGIPKRADRLKAIGNGQCPAALVLAWNTLIQRIP
jgi:DNA (cytosine-5)-methyltransferase 1